MGNSASLGGHSLTSSPTHHHASGAPGRQEAPSGEVLLLGGRRRFAAAGAALADSCEAGDELLRQWQEIKWAPPTLLHSLSLPGMALDD
eukprot:3957625-Alexandrium_andersonii.AAC.1